jgi:hypothetical protein
MEREPGFSNDPYRLYCHLRVVFNSLTGKAWKTGSSTLIEGLAGYGEEKNCLKFKYNVLSKTVRDE